MSKADAKCGCIVLFTLFMQSKVALCLAGLPNTCHSGVKKRKVGAGEAAEASLVMVPEMLVILI